MRIIRRAYRLLVMLIGALALGTCLCVLGQRVTFAGAFDIFLTMLCCFF